MTTWAWPEHSDPGQTATGTPDELTGQRQAKLPSDVPFASPGARQAGSRSPRSP